MDLKAGIPLIPPPVKNSSCTHPRFIAGHSFISHIGLADTVEAFLITVLTIGVIGANALVIFVINNHRYTPYIPLQPRYLLTSLALNDLAIGLLITPLGLVPSLLHCWPYGEIFCQIQALLRGALSQQSAVILVCMAIDRYICALHPRRYQQHSSKKGCVALLSITWIMNLSVFGMFVLPKGYYFNNTGLMACEPFYSKPSYRILATCALYFPTTMILMYCYGSSFHMSRFRLNSNPAVSPTTSYRTTFIVKKTAITGIEEQAARNEDFNNYTSRSMAAISLGFIVMVTPWTIQEIVAACTGSRLPSFLDFLVTWIALSNSFWNPFLYWLLNGHFRRLARVLLSNRFCPYEGTPKHKTHCCDNDYDASLGLPALPDLPQSRSLQYSTPQSIHLSRSDVEGMSEKYWGEILERTVSSGSLHALQRSFSQHIQSPYHHNHSELQSCQDHNVDEICQYQRHQQQQHQQQQHQQQHHQQHQYQHQHKHRYQLQKQQEQEQKRQLVNYTSLDLDSKNADLHESSEHHSDYLTVNGECVAKNHNFKNFPDI